MNRILLLALLALGLTSCKCICCIDEDLSECPVNEGVEYEIDYELHLVTNVTTELETELSLEAEAEVQQELREYLKNIFTDYARDVNLSFYNPEEPKNRLQHFTENMNANQRTYTLTIPRRTYRHLGVANLRSNNIVTLDESEYSNTSRLGQLDADSIGCHSTGLFSARLDMDIKADATEDQIFYVKLYMVNAAAALVIDTTGVKISNMQAFSTGFYDEFEISDSVYTMKRDKRPIVRSDRLKLARNNKVAFCSVNMPSPETPPAPVRPRVVIDTDEPFISGEQTDGIWQYQVYVTLPDGSVTKSELNMRKPLRAGQLKVIKCRLRDDGALEPYDANVGVSVTLDWQNAGEHNIDL